jgi:hypothetical protein
MLSDRAREQREEIERSIIYLQRRHVKLYTCHCISAYALLWERSRITLRRDALASVARRLGVPGRHPRRDRIRTLRLKDASIYLGVCTESYPVFSQEDGTAPASPSLVLSVDEAMNAIVWSRDDVYNLLSNKSKYRFMGHTLQ